MSARELITEHLDLWTGAVTRRSTSGRGSNGKVELTGVKRLRELILQLAVTGRLVEQDASDEPANELTKRIQAGKDQLSQSSKQRKAKTLPPISESEEPFSLPSGWALSRLDDITDIQGGIAKGKKVAGKKTRTLPYLRVANVQRSSLDLSEIKEIEIAEEEIERYLVRQRDLLITEGGDWDKLGRTAIWDGRVEPMAHQNHVFRARLILGEQNERWLERYLNSRFARDYFASSSKQTTNLASINKTQLRSCTVPLPPVKEQARIVQKVDELMALCDRLEQQTSDQLEAHETLVDTLLGTLTQSEKATELADNWARLAAHFDTLFTTEQSIDKLKQTILQLAVMGRLVEQDAGDEPATELLKRIQAGKDQLSQSSKQRKAKPLPPISKSEEPFSLPSGWALSRLDDITDIQGGVAKGKKVTGKKTRTLPYLRVANVQRSSLDLSEIKEIEIAEGEVERYLVRRRDLLITEGGDWDKVGRTAIWDGHIEPMAHQNHVFRARLILQEQNERWLERYLNSQFARDYFASSSKQTTNLASINKTQLRSCTVPLPPLDEQHRIVQKVDELMALCDQLKERLNQASETRCQLAETVVEGALR